jgi:hypothetical protein
MSKEVNSYLDHGKSDISLAKLVKYVVIFIVPLLVSFALSIFISGMVAEYFEVSALTMVQILMIPFTLIIFLFIIPYVKSRENIQGIRYSLMVFVIAGVAMTLPAVLQGYAGILLNQLVYLASYILLTFIYVPEVLGLGVDLSDWFKHHKQLILLVVYLAIILFYIIGFGALYHDIYYDPAHPAPFNFGDDVVNPSYGTFTYYSLVTFATVGYGDIYPVSRAARFTMGLEAIFGMVINVVFIAILLVFISGSQSREVKKEEAVLKREGAMIKKEEEAVEEEKEMIEEQKEEIEQLEDREEEDIKHLLKKIESIKK